jgi:hypothetical protein
MAVGQRGPAPPKQGREGVASPQPRPRNRAPIRAGKAPVRDVGKGFALAADRLVAPLAPSVGVAPALSIGGAANRQANVQAFFTLREM